MIAKKSMLSLLILCSMAIGVGGCGTPGKPAVSTIEYPVKPITFIVPYAAGGSADMMARAMERAVYKHLGQPLVVKNIPGGASTLGMNELAGAEPDGYTIGYVSMGAVLQPLYGQTRYHYVTALDPLVQIMSTPAIAVVSADRQWKSIVDLVEYAKNHPGEIKYGHSGLGSGNHVVGEIFAKVAGIDIVQVPFRGESEALAAVLGGHVQLMFTNPPAIQEFVRSKKIKILAVAAETRLTDDLFKDAATFQEQGYDVVFYARHALGAPKGMPAEVKAQLVERLDQIVHDPEFKKNMQNLGMTIEYLGNKEFSMVWLKDNRRITKIVKETGIAEKIAAQKN